MIFSPDSHLYELSGKYHWTPRRAKVAWQRTWFALEEYLRWMPRPKKAVILMGAPASGKSSWLSENREKNTIYFDACFDTDWKRAKFTKRVWGRWNDLPETTATLRQDFAGFEGVRLLKKSQTGHGWYQTDLPPEPVPQFHLWHHEPMVSLQEESSQELHFF